MIINRSAAATVCPASQRDRVLLERAADPLHRAGVNSKLFGNDADTGPPRSRQSLPDSLFQCIRDVAPALNGRASLAGARPGRTGAASFMVARARGRARR